MRSNSRFIRAESRFMRPLTSDIQLYTAQMNRTLSLYLSTRSSLAAVFTEMSVAVKGERYVRGVCTFKYVG
ncbi:hypothetical protein DET54_106237 [Paenibacillus pabuli]|uniref:Uncharacterized protein n=1 Tax=Paenibacillus pabuli TaxID=1472 RepID=A0ABX9BK86_9BACL|nr:hypothetical protein DET54_106237 [Paenibacillus pabuli]